MTRMRLTAEARRNPARVLILGGYGHFGARVSRALAARSGLEIVIAGRQRRAAHHLAAQLRTGPGTRVTAQALDHRSAGFRAALARVNPAILVHAAGPFQGQNYQVARTCIELGLHYMDLADGRAFVTGIAKLDPLARARGVLVISGASTVPALSAAVLNELTADLAGVTGIQISIAPGQQTPRGLATIAGALSYCGRPFKRLQGGRWVTAYGWQGLRRAHYPRLGRRWLAGCDVPDLDLLPRQFPHLQAVSCDAALELAPLTMSLWCLSWLARWGLVADWTRHAEILSRAADLFDRFGTDVGGMHVGVTGVDPAGRSVRKDWHLTARSGHGPEIPATPAVILAGKLARREICKTGALPCTGLLTLNDFAAALAHLDVSWDTEVRPAGAQHGLTATTNAAAGDTVKGKLYPLQS